MTKYSITNWGSMFESYETKKLTHLKWVPIPNKHDGLGYRKLAAQQNRCELFAAWILILQVASKSKKSERGDLVRDGEPLTSSDLAMMTGFPEEVFAEALTFFSNPKIGWLTVDTEGTYNDSAVCAAASAVHLGVKQPEGNGRERNNSLACEATIVGEAAKEPARLELAIEIYECYPKKAEKQDAIKAILKAMKSHASDFLLKQTIAYADVVKGCDPQYVPYPAKWFRKERFNDDPSTWKINPPKTKPRRAMGHI